MSGAKLLGMSRKTRVSESKLPWAIAIVLVIVLNLLLFNFRVGQCTDYSVESGMESTCTSRPALGIPGTWVIAVLSLLAIGYFTYRMLRRSRSERAEREYR
jgi:hypothetical protein